MAGDNRPGLLILFAPADHPHRDAVCATLSWLAAEEGLLFECYYDSRHTGVHFGGGLPWRVDPADLRGGTFIGGRHMEQFAMLLGRFDCQVACLGETVFAPAIAAAHLPVRASTADVVDFYRTVFAGSPTPWPETLLVIGRGDVVNAIPYACQEIAQRRVLAIADGDPNAESALAAGMQVEHLWTAQSAPSESGTTVEARSLAMASRWSEATKGYLLGDPEMVGRWIPYAVRNGWAPVYGIPQVDVVARLAERLGSVAAVWGRQQDDADFLALSRAGVAFQLIDPGRPPFPVIAEVARPTAATLQTRPAEEPSDGELARWAEDSRVVTSILFWAGMVRELECFYALTEILQDTGLKAGVALTADSFRFIDSNPLGLLHVPSASGGLAGQVESLIASAGAGGMLESAAPPDRFGRILRESVSGLAGQLGGREHVPAGWWGVMDAPLVPRKIGRVAVSNDPPALKVRYRRRALAYSPAADAEGGNQRDLRTRVRESPLGGFFEPIRPFDEWQPGPPSRVVLGAVRDAGFDYALTKAEFGAPPTLVTGVDGLTVINYTSGRWDGWTPFETINDIHDVTRAESRLLRSGRPGWLVGGIDCCLWTFSGNVLDRGHELRDICARLARGGGSGKLINVTPHTAARYARMLGERRQVRKVGVS